MLLSAKCSARALARPFASTARSMSECPSPRLSIVASSTLMPRTPFWKREFSGSAGPTSLSSELRERFNNESDINLLEDEQYHDIHAVASLLKLYLRELPTTILTRDLHLEFLSATEITDHREKIAALGELVQRLPQANATLLKYLIAFLIKIINNSDVNKMTVRNVGIVFSPTLNIPAPVFAMFLQNYEGIFGIDPVEYELPSPVSDNNERRPSLPTGERPSFGERRPSDSQRPSTSGTGSSPHRQRLMDAVREGQRARSTPTPPPVMNIQQMAQMNAMRTTPTPPPQRPVTYEPQFLAQQGQTAANRMSVRPAYESGFTLLKDLTRLKSTRLPDGQPTQGTIAPFMKATFHMISRTSSLDARVACSWAV